MRLRLQGYHNHACGVASLRRAGIRASRSSLARRGLPDQCLARRFELDGDIRCSPPGRVLDHLLNHRNRHLKDLSSGDLVSGIYYPRQGTDGEADDHKHVKRRRYSAGRKSIAYIFAAKPRMP